MSNSVCFISEEGAAAPTGVASIYRDTTCASFQKSADFTEPQLQRNNLIEFKIFGESRLNIKERNIKAQPCEARRTSVCCRGLFSPLSTCGVFSHFSEWADKSFYHTFLMTEAKLWPSKNTSVSYPCSFLGFSTFRRASRKGVCSVALMA